MDKIYFTINGEHYSLAGSDVHPDTSLNDYLRQYVNVRGTKVMCHEGGCGACLVAVTHTHPLTKERHTFAVNSCLVHVLSCHQWDITTVEGVGNRKDGYHKIQTRLANFNGTQCGYCTPGWVMNMYSLYESENHKLTTNQIENSFAGNMCRCTGYRPILDAFKSLAIDSDETLKGRVRDLEDLADIKCVKKECSRSCTLDKDWCIINNDRLGECMKLEVGDKNRWYKAFKIQDVFSILAREGIDSYRLVAGNTGKGVFPITDEPRILIDISSIESLKEATTDMNLVLGAGMTLSEVMIEFQKSARNADFSYLTHFYNHLDLVAHVPVRNIGTIGGNLAMKNRHHDFPSDVYLLLETVQAAVTIMDKNLKKRELSMTDFLNEDLKDKLIYNIKLPPLSPKCLIRTYKIMPRAQNSHAIVNAGFLFKIDKDDRVEHANIVYGCIRPDFVTASQTANGLKGADLFDNHTLQSALKRLNEELTPNLNPPEPSPFSRKMIAMGLFYKCILDLAPDSKVNPLYKSGGQMFHRPLSRGTQSFDTDKKLWPLNKPIPKLEALIQCSGEARYSNDLPSMPREVHVAFVLSNVFSGDIESFDPSEALKIPGVVTFMTAKDIPGKNTFTPTSVMWQNFEEEVLASRRVLFYGQPVALVAAVTERLANKAAAKVKVTYTNVPTTKPVLNVADALAAPKSQNRVRQEIEIKPSSRGSDVSQVIEGSYSVPSQYHYTMEPQTCVVVPHEGSYDVHSATQWMDLVQVAVAGCLDVPENLINVIVNRVGGGYGGKASRASQIAAACALVARRVDRAARLALGVQDNMAAIGKRQDCVAHYEIGVNKEGEIQYLELQYYSDCGCNFNDTMGGALPSTLTNLYESSSWHIVGYSVLTDKASNTWCRAPGTTEATAILEHIMERIAFAVNKDPTDVKILNLSPKHMAVKEMINSFKMDCEVEARTKIVEQFNKDNVWRKRGIKLSVMSFPIEYVGGFGVTVSVYHGDGSVALSHGGVEMGQGVHTKVAQVVAHTLDIPLEKISVKASNSMVSPNSMASNGSITSECVAYAAVKACTDLLQRLRPGDGLAPPAWEEAVADAYKRGVNLQASYMMSLNDDIKPYNVYGVAVAEVELDVLTGTHQVLRVDILEDTGQSLSPEIDVGQIEGAFVMGLGLWTCEALRYDTVTGRLLTDRTWNYKPPGVKDIPVDFRINFKRNSYNNAGVLRSKATGEPALVLAVVVANALRDAAVSGAARPQQPPQWLEMETPYTVDNIIQGISLNIEKFQLV